jgi:hypothetical protein
MSNALILITVDLDSQDEIAQNQLWLVR